MKKLSVMSTVNSAYFAERIALSPELGVTIVPIERNTFPDGERYTRIGIKHMSDLTGRDVVLVGSTNTDADLLEMSRLGSAIAEHGANRLIMVIPFLGYSTMERAVKPGEVVTAKTNARVLSSIPLCSSGNTLLFMDLHVSGLLHYFEGDCQRAELYGEMAIIGGISRLRLENYVLGSADLGRPKWVNSLARTLGAGIAFVRKTRHGADTEVHEVIGDVRGKPVVIYDDMIRSGGSLIKAANAYLAHGATAVYAAVSHLALPDEATIARLEQSPICHIICTNTHPMSQHPAVQNSKKFRVYDVSDTFVRRIQTIVGLKQGAKSCG